MARPSVRLTEQAALEVDAAIELLGLTDLTNVVSDITW